MLFNGAERAPSIVRNELKFRRQLRQVYGMEERIPLCLRQKDHSTALNEEIQRVILVIHGETTQSTFLYTDIGQGKEIC